MTGASLNSLSMVGDVDNAAHCVGGQLNNWTVILTHIIGVLRNIKQLDRLGDSRLTFVRPFES